MVARNRLLFHLRNLTTAGSLDAVINAIAESGTELTRSLVDWGTLGGIARARLWNHLAPVADEAIISDCGRSVSPGICKDRGSHCTTHRPEKHEELVFVIDQVFEISQEECEQSLAGRNEHGGNQPS